MNQGRHRARSIQPDALYHNQRRVLWLASSGAPISLEGLSDAAQISFAGLCAEPSEGFERRCAVGGKGGVFGPAAQHAPVEARRRAQWLPSAEYVVVEGAFLESIGITWCGRERARWTFAGHDLADDEFAIGS